MSWYTNLKTSQKILVFFGVLAASLVITAWNGGTAARAMKDNQVATFETDLKTTEQVKEIQGMQARISRLALMTIIEPDASKEATMVRQLGDEERALTKSLAEVSSSLDEEASRNEVTEVSRIFPEYMSTIREAIRVSPQGSDPGDPPRMLVLLYDSMAKSAAMEARLKAVVDRTRATAAARAAASQTEYDRNVKTTLALLVVALGLGLLFTRTISGAIATPLRATVETLRQVAQGDLTVRLDVDRRDEIGELAEAFNATVDSMRQTLASVVAVSLEVSSSSSELAENSTQISAGAQQQAASLEETAASLEEISATVKQNTDNASEASQVATSARDAAERGGAVVGGAVAAMEEITKASKKIADIIATIDEIAFQTNLLALNAAVEAARAGEQGRGFAVVAAEVRTLAQRTGTAAKEIRGLIADSSAKVEVGTHQVNESGKTLEEIVRSVKKVTDMVAEITAASREQSSGLDQVNVAVTQVDQVTQSNAAQTEELSATATSLSDKAAHLQKLVSSFQLGRGTVTAAAQAMNLRPPAELQRAAGAKVVPMPARRSPPPLAKASGFEEV